MQGFRTPEIESEGERLPDGFASKIKQEPGSEYFIIASPPPRQSAQAHCWASVSVHVRLCPLPHYKCSLSITTQGYNNQILNYLFQRLFSAYLSCEIPRDVCAAIYLRGNRSPEHYGKNFITWGGRWQNQEHTSHPSEVRPSQGLTRSSTLQWLGPQA